MLRDNTSSMRISKKNKMTITRELTRRPVALPPTLKDEADSMAVTFDLDPNPDAEKVS